MQELPNKEIVMKQIRSKKSIHAKRVARIRVKVRGSAVRPRICIFRSNTTIYAQVIDDEKRKTLCSYRAEGKNVKAAKELAEKIARDLKAQHITKVVFDRGGYRYHGGIKALADTLREGGITI